MLNETPVGPSIQNKRFVNISKFRRTIAEIEESGDYFDLICQVLQVYSRSEPPLQLLLWDGSGKKQIVQVENQSTEFSKLSAFIDQMKTKYFTNGISVSTEREHIPLASELNLIPFEVFESCAWGASLVANVWHAEYAQVCARDVKPGQWMQLKNVQCKRYRDQLELRVGDRSHLHLLSPHDPDVHSLILNYQTKIGAWALPLIQQQLLNPPVTPLLPSTPSLLVHTTTTTTNTNTISINTTTATTSQSNNDIINHLIDNNINSNNNNINNNKHILPQSLDLPQIQLPENEKGFFFISETNHPTIVPMKVKQILEHSQVPTKFRLVAQIVSYSPRLEDFTVPYCSYCNQM